MFRGGSASSRGGGQGSSAYERVNPGDGGSLPLGTRANSSGCAASSGSEDFGSLGVGTLVASSTLGVNDMALSVEAGSTESILVTSNILRSNRLPLFTMGVRHWWSSWTDLQSTPGAFQHKQCSAGGPSPVPQFPHALPLDNCAIPRNPSVEESLFSLILTPGMGGP